ncbi:MAG: YceI family protein [Bacteroidetes bacterium]|nr:MAG: YceI family protein [Bacteroidota bacterium]
MWSCLAYAQEVYTISASGTHMSITGTSSLHEWESTVQTITGKGVLALEAGALTDVVELTVEVPVKSIKSGKGQMDNNTYEALKADAHPNLTYRLTEVTSVTPTSNGWKLSTRGQLTLAGKTRSITVQVQATRAAGNNLTFTGSIPIHMPDYGIDPPTALFGTITTGADVKVPFTLTMRPDSPN